MAVDIAKSPDFELKPRINQIPLAKSLIYNMLTHYKILSVIGVH
jgi:hypothetical protein